jgi:hypothetical protein
MDPKKERRKGRALRIEPDCPGRENKGEDGHGMPCSYGKKAGSGGINPPLHEEVLVVIAVVIVVVIVPIAVGVPAAIVFVPPFVFVGPAVLTGFAEFVASVFRLSAFPTMVSSSLVQLMVGFRQAVLTFAFVGADGCCADENKSSCQHRCREQPS